MKKKYLLWITLGTAMTFSLVWIRLKIVNISYEIHELKKQEKALQEETFQLTLKYNEARSPYRLEKIAAKKFKMQPARPDQWVVLRSKK